MEPSRIMVTGGAGFIGSNFIHHVFHRAGIPAVCCPDEAHYTGSQELPTILNVDHLTYAADLGRLSPFADLKAYSFLQGDVADAATMERACMQLQPEVIVHFAAESHVDRSIASGTEFARTNVLGTQVVLDAARRHDAKVLHISTDEVYGSIEKGSFTESDPLAPSSPYSASKAGSDLLALAHHRTYGLKVDVTRCTNNFGPRQHPEKLVAKAVSCIEADVPIPVYGNGRQVRDWLYVKDHCSALLRLLGVDGGGRIFNIAGRQEQTNLEILDLVRRAMGKPDHRFEHVNDRPGHDFRYSVDDRKMREQGWSPRIGLRQGLEYTLASMQGGP